MTAGPRLFRRLFRLAEDAAIVVVLAAMIVIACLQVGLRFLDTGLPWADALLRYLVLWGGMLGAVVATRDRGHINIDLASRLLPPGWRRWLTAVADLFSAVVCAFLCYAAVAYVRDEAAFGGVQTSLGIAYWRLNLVFPAAFAVITARFALAAIAAVTGRAE